VNGDAVVIDSSVIVAIYKGEADSVRLTERIAAYKRKLMSAATWLEAAMVCESASPGGEIDFSRLIDDFGIELVPLTAEQARLAFDAFKRLGKGRGTKASLNFGDCFVYALAKELSVPLLFKGGDFARTDIQTA
jgi:ribonuclease VapC